MKYTIFLLWSIILLIIAGWFGGAYAIIKFLHPNSLGIVVGLIFFGVYPFITAAFLCKIFDFSH